MDPKKEPTVGSYHVSNGEPRWERSGKLAGAASLSTDGKWLAVARDKGVELWDAATGKTVRTLDADFLVHSTRISSDGSRVVAVSHRGDIGVWDRATGNRLSTLPNLITEQVQYNWPSFAISPNGRSVAMADVPGGRITLEESYTLESTVHVRTVDDGTVVRLGSVKGIAERGIHFNPTGTRLAVVSRTGDLSVFDVPNRKLAVKIPIYKTSVYGARFSPDGKEIAAWGFGAHAPTFFDVETGKPVRIPDGHLEPAAPVRFSGDGARVITSGSQGEVRLWDARTGKPIDGPSGIPGYRAVDANNDLTRIAWTRPGGGTRYVTDETANVLVTDSTGRILFRTPPAKEAVASVSLSPNGTSLVTWQADADGLCRWDLHSGKLDWKQPLKDRVGQLSWSKDERFVGANRLGAVLVLNATDGTLHRTVTYPQFGGIDFHRFSSDGEWLAVCPGTSFTDPTVFSTSTGKTKPRLVPADWPVAERATNRNADYMALSNDDRILAYAGQDRGLHLFEWAGGMERRTIRLANVRMGRLTFSPDGRTIATAHPDTTVLLWDVWGLLPDEKIVADVLTESSAAKLTEQLKSSDAIAAFRAMRQLATRADLAVPALEKALRLPTAFDTKKIQELIVRLDSSFFADREAAEKELDAFGRPLQPTLSAALAETKSAEVKQRLTRLLAAFDGYLTGDELFHARAVELLERIGTPAANGILEKWAKAPAGTVLAEETGKALKRMK